MQPKEILKEHVNKTISLTDTQFDYFFSHFTHKTFKKGQTIIGEGDNVDCEYFVLSGYMKSFFITDDMKMFILQFAMPASWASDYNALYSEEQATINLDCITDTEVLCLTSANREKLCNVLEEAENFFNWRTNKGYVATQQRLLSFMNDDAQHRYEELLTQYPTISNIAPKQLIASYLGVSSETLSRLHA
jgi:CRP-like cAMP-binding protein